MATNTGHAEMPYRVLGSTKERVSAIGLGGWHLGLKKVDEPLSIRIVRDAIHRGINFMDNCWDYNDGASERGKAMGSDFYKLTISIHLDMDVHHGAPSPTIRPRGSLSCDCTRQSAAEDFHLRR